MWHTVTDDDTAIALGSGDVPALATPRLVAWMEAATVRAATPLIDEWQTSVGVDVRVKHRRPAHVGGRVEVSAMLPEGSSSQRLVFSVRAVDDGGEVVADGQIDRVIVDRDRFFTNAPGD